MKFAHLSNEELLVEVHALIGQGRVLLARLLAHLAEVEERRLDAQSACSSLFDFCMRRLGMSEDQAYRRVTASRLARRFPLALGMIERGEIHLTALLLLREHLTDDNHEELIRAAAGKTKAQILELLAARSPRPDAPSQIRRLPEAPAQQPMGAAPVPKTSRVEPLAPDRFKVQFTATAALKEKIEHVTNLMRHSNPSGDLALIMERAIDLLVAELEKRRLGKTKRPAATSPRRNVRSGHVTRAVRREVFARDAHQCSFTDAAGRRCESRTFLELDHREPRALGGGDDATNVAVLCRYHNQWEAERIFGREYIDEKKAARRKPGIRTSGSPGTEANPPRQRGEESQRALRALTTMGFKESQARRALGIVESRRADQAPSLETVLRETLSLLT